MRLRVLGSGAGGGVPQWNCRCALCSQARSGSGAVRGRLHASIAVSADEQRWVICNAGPDIQHQIEAFPALLPREGVRGTSIAAVVLSGADLDQVLGLLLLREGDRLQVYGTTRTRLALSEGLRLLPALDMYGGIDWQDMALDTDISLRDAQRMPLGLRVRAFDVVGGPPPYAGRRDEGHAGDTVGLLITDEARGSSLAYIPSCGAITDDLLDLLGTADCVLFDATVWRDDEITVLGVPGRTGRHMRHLPLSEPGGALERLQTLRNRRILTHLNNTNPLLVEGGLEQAAAAALGWEVAFDGLEVTL